MKAKSGSRGPNLDGLLVRPFAPTDGEGFIRAFEETFGQPMGGVSSGGHLQWQYLSVPEDRLWITLAVPRDEARSGEVAAAYAVLPRRFHVDGRDVMGALSLDTLTTESWRKRGLFVHLAKTTYARAQEEGLAFVYGFPNPNSLPGFLKHLEWTTQPPQKVWVTARPWAPISRWLRARAPADAERVVDRVDERFDSLWAVVRGELGRSAVRDRAWVQWRYLDRPHNSYRLHIAESGDQLLAWCVTATAARAEGTRGFLVDYLAPHEHQSVLGTLIRKAVSRVASEDGALAFQALASPTSGFKAALRRGGFVQVPDRYQPHNPMAWTSFREEPPLAAPPFHITYGDSDVF